MWDSLSFESNMVESQRCHIMNELVVFGIIIGFAAGFLLGSSFGKLRGSLTVLRVLEESKKKKES